MYARGQQDKAAGMSESDARHTAEAIKQQAAHGTRTEHAFTGNASDKWDNAMEIKMPSCSATSSPVPISTAILG